MRVPIAANLGSRDGTLTKGPLLTNAYVDSKSKDQPVVVRRPGLASVVDLGSGAGQGITSYKDANGDEFLFSLTNSSLYNGAAFLPNTTFTYYSNPVVPPGPYNTGPSNFSFGGYLWAVGSAQQMNVTADKVWYSGDYGATWTLAASSIWGAGVYRGNQTPLVVNKQVYVFGGNDAGGLQVAEVWRSANGTTWTQLTAAAAFGACRYPRIVYLNGTFYFLGGETGDGTSTNTWTNSVYSSTDGITWSLVTATPSWGGTTAGTKRSRYGVCVHNGRMYVAGGSTYSGSYTYKNDVWYSTDGSTWTQATASATWSTREIATIFNCSGIMVIFGGSGSNPERLYYSTNGSTWTYSSDITIAASNYNWASSPIPCIHKGRIAVYGLYINGAPTRSGASIGTIPLAAGEVADFSNTYDNTSIMIRASTAAYKLNTADSTITQITDSNYPSITVRGNPYLNGYFYVMEPDGTIWNSAEDDCTSWAGTDFISAEVESDGGVCLARAGNDIVALGQYTTQFFWDAGNATGSPLLPVENGTMLIGCAHGNSVAQMENTIVWIAQRKGQGSSYQKGRFVVFLKGRGYEEIGTPDISRVLDADDLATVYSTIMSVAGHTFYVLTLGTSAITLVYDFTTGLWYRWTRCTAGSALTVSTLTQSNGTATATTSGAHGLSDGDPVTIAGATPSGYNGAVNVTVTGSTTFTYPVSSALSTPATGTITATPVTESTFAFTGSCNYDNKQVVQESDGGEVFYITEDVGQDDDVLINMKVRTDKFDGGSDLNKFMPWLEIIGDKPASAVNILVRYTDNDYQSYSKYRRANLALERVRLNRLGKFRRRAFELRYTGTSDLRLEAVEAQIDGGSV